MRAPRFVALAGLLVLVAVSSARSAQGGLTAELPVVDAAGFANALKQAQPGDVIRLASANFADLTIKGRSYAGLVHIVGSGGTQVGRLTVDGSRNVSIEDLTVTPSGPVEARVAVDRSSQITFLRIRFVGVNPKPGVELDVGRDSSQINVTDSEFTLCRSGRPCLQPGGREITVLRSKFHDCFDCDMVRGGGSGVTITDSTFERALRGSGQNHNDLIQIMGGGPWRMERNHFGQRQGGAAQVFVGPGSNNTSNPIHDVTVASSLFTGDMANAIFVAAGQKSKLGTPQRVKIVNNTILSGRSGAIRLGEPFASVTPDQRPIVANNILGVSTGENCNRALTVRNLVVIGKGCAGDEVGPSNLDAAGAPTAGSLLVIDSADPAYAPALDLFEHARKGAPDIGAIEFGATAPVRPLQLTAPAKLGFRLKAVRARGWRLAVRVGLTGGKALSARLRQGSKTVATAAYPVAGKTRFTFSLRLPPVARKAKRLSLSLRLTGEGNRIVTRGVQVFIFR